MEWFMEEIMKNLFKNAFKELEIGNPAIFECQDGSLEEIVKISDKDFQIVSTGNKHNIDKYLDKNMSIFVSFDINPYWEEDEKEDNDIS